MSETPTRSKHKQKHKKKTSKSKSPRPNYKSHKLVTQRASVDNALIHQRKKKPNSKPRTPSRDKHSHSIESKPHKTPKKCTTPTPKPKSKSKKPSYKKTSYKKRKKKPHRHKNGTPKSPQSSSLSLSHHSVLTPKPCSPHSTASSKPSLGRAQSVRPAKKSSHKSKSKSKPKSKKKSSNKSNQRASVGNALIDHRKNLSPNHSPNKRKKVSNKQKSAKTSAKHAKKRSFYSELYSTKTKGKLQTLYKVKEKIGSGTFSTVRRGIRRSDKLEIAIKIITKTELNDTEARLIKREIGVMKKLDHANIVRLYDIFETQHHLYLVIEYCRGGELFDELINCTPSGWFSEREASQIIRQIADALHYMHSKDIIHRDLKLENILIAMKKKYALNLRQKKFSMDDDDDEEENEDCNRHLKQQKQRKRGGSSHHVQSKTEHAYPDEDRDYQSESEGSDYHDFINRRHSEHISKIPSSLMYGVNGNHINDHKQSSIIVKVSDFGLSKKLARPRDHPTSADHEERKSDGSEDKAHKKKKKTHILSKRKRRRNDEINDSQYAVMATNCGTLYYVAPEILNNEPYNEKVDMWSLGVICYVLLCGSLPFYSENELEISDAICSGKYDLGETDEHWLKVSDSAKDLIQTLLTLDKVNRLSATQVLAHPFITGQNELTTTKRKSVRWNAGALLGKWPMKFRHMIDSAKVTFGTDSNSDVETTETSGSEYEGKWAAHDKNKKRKYKISIDSELQTENSAVE